MKTMKEHRECQGEGRDEWLQFKYYLQGPEGSMQAINKY